jgi:ATP-binding cassette subfamily B protein
MTARSRASASRTGSARPGSRAALTLGLLLPRVSGLLSGALAAMAAVQVLLVVGFIFATANLVGVLAASGRPGAADGRLWLDVVIVCAVFVLRFGLQPAVTATTAELGRRVNEYLARITLRGVMRPAGIGHLSDPLVADRIFQAQNVGIGYPPGQAVASLTTVAVSRLTGIASVILLAGVKWWMPLPLTAAWIIAGRWRDREVRRAISAQQDATPSLRHAAYTRDLAIAGAAAKEIRIFGIQDWLLSRFSHAWTEGMTQLGESRFTRVRSGALLTASYASVLVPLALWTADGSVSVHQVTIALQAIPALGALGWLGDVQWLLSAASAAIPPALEVAQLGTGEAAGREARETAGRQQGAGRARTGGRSAAGMPASGITFECVSFGYPDRPVLSGLDLEITAGSSLALVGSNGAGKSTLIKLLGRLYDPGHGRIRVDGAELCDLDLASWRRQLAVVFQDFVRYELPLRDNVGFGRADAPRTDGALAAAARLADLDCVVARLPAGWDTPLSRRLDGGTDLSGGQWQRVVLARALFAVEHGARVLVLDEPTAHLDIRAETELYERLLDVTRGLTTILVSHRFATVRLADKICVLDAGRIIEQGTHAELVAAGGPYSRMFALQSAPFQVSPSPLDADRGRVDRG